MSMWQVLFARVAENNLAIFMGKNSIAEKLACWLLYDQQKLLHTKNYYDSCTPGFTPYKKFKKCSNCVQRTMRSATACQLTGMPRKPKEKTIINRHNRLKIPNWREADLWLFTNIAEFNKGLRWKDSVQLSGLNWTWIRHLQILGV